jgi:hypothetical protein
MKIEEHGVIASDDDMAFLEEMSAMGIFKDTSQDFGLRNLAKIWYERGYHDRMYEENIE